MDAPKIVTDTTTQRWSRRRFTGGAVVPIGVVFSACDFRWEQASDAAGVRASCSGQRAAVR